MIVGFCFDHLSKWSSVVQGISKFCFAINRIIQVVTKFKAINYKICWMLVAILMRKKYSKDNKKQPYTLIFIAVLQSEWS